MERVRNKLASSQADSRQPAVASHSVPNSYAEAVAGREFRLEREFSRAVESVPQCLPSQTTCSSYASVTSPTKVNTGQEARPPTGGRNQTTRGRKVNRKQESHSAATDERQHQNSHGQNHGHHGGVSDRAPHVPTEPERVVPSYKDYHCYTNVTIRGEATRITFGDFDVEVEEETMSPEGLAVHSSYAAAASGRHEEHQPGYPGSAGATSGGAYSGGLGDWPQNQRGFESCPAEEIVGSSCICVHLWHSLQEWCSRTHGANQHHRGDHVHAVLELLDHLRNSFNGLHISGDPHAEQLILQSFRQTPVCPSHGFSGISVQLLCTECVEQLNTLSSVLAAAMSDKKSPAEDEQTRKAMDRATRSLARLNERAEAAMRAVKGDRHLDEMVDSMDARKEELHRAMEEHVKRLHETINFYYEVALEDFLKAHSYYRQQALQEKQKLDDFASSIMYVQTEVHRKLTDSKERGLAATNTVPAFLQKCTALLDNKPQIQAVTCPEYNIEIQETADREIASLVGRFRVTEGAAVPASVPSEPDMYEEDEGVKDEKEVEEKAAEEEGDDTENATQWSEGNGENPGWSTYAERLDPYYPYMEGGKDASGSYLGNKDKYSAFMASTSSVASSVSNAGNGAKKRGKRKKKKDKTERGDLPYFSKERLQSKPQALTVNDSIPPTLSRFKGPEPKSIAATKNGKIWAVFGIKNPELQLLNQDGTVSQKCRVGGNAMAVACLSEKRVVLACHSPSVHLMTADIEGNCTDVLDQIPAPTSVSVGKTGVVVSGHTTLLWASRSKWFKRWIVPAKKSPLKEVCATAVTFFNHAELICAADSEGKAVHFYIKSENEGFSPLRPYCGPPASPGQDPADFVPISLAAHPESFLAILDSASNSVHVLNVEQSHQAVSVIPGRQLYRSHVPSLIALGYKDRSDEDLKLWVVASSSGACWICQTALKFRY